MLRESSFAGWLRGLQRRREPQPVELAFPPAPTEPRDAYLDLLKRSLCDLLGPETKTSVPQPDGGVVVERLDDLEMRRNGKEWPTNGTTMVGLKRLDQLQRCVETVVREGVPGNLIETGVWRGGASILTRATLRMYDATDREVWLADSFEGLPPADPEYPVDAGADILSTYDFLAVSEGEVRAAFDRYGLLDDGVRFLRGWFRDTLPPLRGRNQWSVLRLDGDHYESTIIALESLYPDLSPGGFVIVDDYAGIPQCRQAVDDFRRDHGIEEELHTIDWTGVWWRRRSADGSA
jgi:O-methyltransferase